MTRQHIRFFTSPLMPLSIMVLTLLVSLVLFAIFQPDMDGRVFYYPDNSGTRIGSERRGIPHRQDIEGQIMVFLEELVLGPVDLELTRTAPRGMSFRHAALRGKTAYIDMDKSILKIEKELPISFDQALDNIRYNILFNFPGIEELIFTIEGQQVHSPLYRGPDDAE